MIVDEFYSEFEQEFKGTRKVLENLDFSKFDFKPHPRSFSLKHLAMHLANISYWGLMTLTTDKYHLKDSEVNPDFNTPETKEEMLRKFDENVRKFLDVLRGMNEEQMDEIWTLYYNGKPFFGEPRHSVLRSSVMNHMIHHRGQLTVYLRMNDLRVPGLYGPSADDKK